MSIEKSMGDIVLLSLRAKAMFTWESEIWGWKKILVILWRTQGKLVMMVARVSYARVNKRVEFVLTAKL
jgi:hypothetical protein